MHTHHIAGEKSTIGDRCYTTRSGLRIGAGYQPPIRCNPEAIERCAKSSGAELRDMAVIWACIVALCALTMILLMEEAA